MRVTRRTSRRKPLVETENRPCRRKNICKRDDNIKKVVINGCNINNISSDSASTSDNSNNTPTTTNNSRSNSTSKSRSNSSDRSNKSCKRLTKMIAAMIAAILSTLLVVTHYSALVQGGTRTGMSPPVMNMAGAPKEALDPEAVASEFAQKHAEDIIDSMADANKPSSVSSGGKRTGTDQKTRQENPDSDKKNGRKNASIGKTPPIPTVGAANKEKKATIKSGEGNKAHGEKKPSNIKKKSERSEMPSKGKKLETNDLQTKGKSTKKSTQEIRKEEEEGDYLSETWSEDGKVHCVEESPDLIRCHTHDDVDEDESFKEKGKRLIAQNVKYGKGPSGNPVVGTQNRLTGSYVNGSHSKKNSPWKGFSRENQPDGLLLPADKISDRKRPLVRLLLTENEPKVMNVDTGEIKPLKKLNETEDVEIDSLVSTESARGRGKFFEKAGTEQSLQDLLTEIREKNFPALDIDYEETLIHRIWQNDDHCHRFATRFGHGVPEVDLVAYWRSGSTWLRYLLEGATGVFTGTAHGTNGLHEQGFLGEAEPPYTRRTLTLRTHSVSANPGVERQAVQGGRDYVPAILLVRNPADAISSHWLARNTSGVNTTSRSSDTFQTPEFHDFFKEALEGWEQTYSNRLLWSRSVHVLYYEDLSRRPLLELLKVLRFMQVPPPSGGRLFCLRKHIDGRFKDRRRKNDPYTTLEEDALWSSVTRVAALLELRGFALPSYHTPLAEYPPDRIYKSFIKRPKEDGSLQKDEL